MVQNSMSSLPRRPKRHLLKRFPKNSHLLKVPVNLDVKIESDSIAVSGTVMQFVFNKDYPLKLEKSINRITNEEDIKGCFSRLGKTTFELANICVDISEGLFVPLSVLNNIRREYFNGLSVAWQNERTLKCDDAKKWLEGEFVTFGNLINEDKHLHHEIPENEARLSLKIDRLNYLDCVLTEKINRLYIVLTDKTVSYLQKNGDIY